MPINHATTGQEWVNAMVSHLCVAGREYDISDDTKQKHVGYACDSCNEVFRISTLNLRNSVGPGLLLALKDRKGFGQKISNPNLTGLISQQAGNNNTSTSGQPGMNRIFNLKNMTDGINIYLD